MTDLDQIVQRAREVLAEVDTEHCPICGWTYAATIDAGCIPGNCSYRPHEGTPELGRIQQRRKEYVKVELAAAVVEMAEELSKARNVFVDELQKRIQELEAQLAQVDDVLIVNHLAAKDGDYRKALADLVTVEISEHDYFADEKLREQLATARKLVEKRRTKPSAARWDDWDEEADQFLKETEGL